MVGLKQFAFLLFCCCVVVCGKKFGTRCKPGSSCKEIKDNHECSESGVYWLDPNGGDHSDAFQAHCDMTSFGGGWTMCYTTDNLVNMRTEIDSPCFDYRENGYRTNCNNITFTEIMFVEEKNEQLAYFSRASGGELVADGNYGKTADAFGLWNAHGVADTSYQYQLNICDDPFYSGLMISGYDLGCYKKCNYWCYDDSSDYYRTASTNPIYAGVSFKENGAKALPKKLMSVGLR